MKIGLKLYETGYRFRSEERARIFLTNTLEPPQDFSGRLSFEIPALAHEAEVVNEVKISKRFTVILGNPPYANFGRLNRNSFILKLLEDYKRDLKEKKLNLDDDFIKFLRYSHHTIDISGTGILGFITNNTYFDGITHRQMRNCILNSMSRIRIIDLHGSAAKKETTPDGSKDENVFDIQQGVGISLWSKLPGRINETETFHADLWGLREKKYNWLQNNSIGQTTFTSIPKNIPFHFFIPKDFNLEEEYFRGVSLLDMFNTNANGIKTDRDDLFFAEDKIELKERIKKFYSPKGLEEPFRSKFRIKNSSSYPILERRKQTQFTDKYIRSCLYRPFDHRWIYYSVGITSRPAWHVMQHMLSERSLGLLAMRQYEYKVDDYCYILATRLIAECRIFVSNRGIANCFPLYQISDTSKQQTKIFNESILKTNLKKDFLNVLADTFNLKCFGEENLPSGITSEDIFNYTYSILHSPNYRSRYAGFLKIDYPRIPLTGSLKLFRLLGKLGAELVALHLMESHKLKKFITSLIGSSKFQVEKVSYSDDTVWINKAKNCGFHGVPEKVWNFQIGGYKVCDKWLKDRQAKGGKNPRPGKVLSNLDIEHYQKIIVVLNETIRIMKEIDEVIDKHGGWPDAFSN